MSFVVMVPAGIALFIAANEAGPRIAALIFIVSMAAVFGCSAAYHHCRVPVRRELLRRLDHSMIYVLIAGTYAPVCLVALPPKWGIPMLITVGLGAAFGVALKAGGVDRYAKLGGALYVILGWVAVLAMPVIATNISAPAFALLVVGGLVYTAGAVILWRQWPNPSPRVFGYHEVWHVFTVAAGGCHFAMVWMVTTAAS